MSALAPGLGARIGRGALTGYVLLLVALPLGTLLHQGFADGLSPLLGRAFAPTAAAALRLSLWTAILVGGVHAVGGTATAWLLHRGRLPGWVSTLVDLPLAVPTLVAGVMLATLYGPSTWLGSHLGGAVIHAPTGIVLALLFVTAPFVVRAVQPVLEAIDPAEEEAALTLGATPRETFRAVYLRPLLPAVLSGATRATARALGEFGSIVVVAGNVPRETLTAPVFVFGEIESGAQETAAAVSVVLLAAALALHLVAERFGASKGAHGAG